VGARIPVGNLEISLLQFGDTIPAHYA